MILVLPYNDVPLSEIRPAYFLRAFGEEMFDMRIFSFGRCNYSCPYCKRNGSNKEGLLDIEGAVEISENTFYSAVDDAISNKQVVRLSGGDPVCYPEFAKKVLRYVKSKGGITSIAHNGSGTDFVKSIIPYLDFTSIDFKAATPNELAKITGINEDMARKCFANTIQTISELASGGVYTDIRTCVFESTTLEQLTEIAKLIQGDNLHNENKFWTLRTYSPIDSFFEKARSPEKMIELAGRLSTIYPELKIGLREKWAPEGFLYFLGGSQQKSFSSKGKRLEFDSGRDDISRI